MSRVLHFSPHPDDETIAAPATLLALAAAGWEVVNIAVGLGGPHQHEERGRAVVEACARMGWRLECLDPPAAISANNDLAAAEQRLIGEFGQLIKREQPQLVIAPSPHDRHHDHEVVARALIKALEAMQAPPVLWMWGFWADLPFPTLVTSFDEEVLQRVQYGLAAHEGEIQRNNYPQAVKARAALNAILGAERVFGFGAPGLDIPYAELLTEVQYQSGWKLGQPRLLDAGTVLTAPSEIDITPWLKGLSLTSRFAFPKRA